jgi:hypothetical protein
MLCPLCVITGLPRAAHSCHSLSKAASSAAAPGAPATCPAKATLP